MMKREYIIVFIALIVIYFYSDIEYFFDSDRCLDRGGILVRGECDLGSDLYTFETPEGKYAVGRIIKKGQ